MPKPPRRPTAGDVDNLMSNWPTLADLPESMRENVIQTNFNLEAHLKKIILSNPWVPPTGDQCPINDLPNELLAHIFALGAVEEEEDPEEDDIYQENIDDPVLVDGDMVEDDGFKDVDEADDAPVLPFQVLVSHVCSHWRTVAIEAPALWTTIKFGEEPAPFTRCRTWVERSKGLPIEIEIDCTREAENETSDHGSDMELDAEREPFFTENDLHAILDLIIPHAECWRALEIEVNEYSFMDIATKALSAIPVAPILEVLQLHHYGEEGDDDEDYEHFRPAQFKDPAPVLFSGNAPKLTHIALWGVHLAWSLEKNLFLKSLKDLELAYHAEDVRPTWSEFEKILLASPELDTLSLCLSGPSGKAGEWEVEGSIELPGLKSLVLAYHTPEYISRLIGILHTPNITSLALDLEDGDYSSFASILASPRPGSASKKSLLSGLEHLKLSGFPCSQDTVDVMYEQLGNLRSINLKCFESLLQDVFFSKLTQPIDPASTAVPTAFYLPNLDTLTTSGISGSQMRQLVEERKKAGVPLKRVFMSEDDDVNINEEVWFRSQLETFELFEPSDDEEGTVIIEDDDMDEN